MFWYDNLTSEGRTNTMRRCLHCSTDGWVTLDDSDGVVPCPVCRLGAHVDAGSPQQNGRTFWQNNAQSIERMTWNNGMHIHQVGQCARGCGRPLAPNETCNNHKGEDTPT